MPDIFLQKQKIQTNTLGKTTYTNYYEIYIQKLHNGLQKFCLQHTNKHLIKSQAETDASANIPLVDFVDIDSDGMIDMVFSIGK